MYQLNMSEAWLTVGGIVTIVMDGLKWRVMCVCGELKIDMLYAVKIKLFTNLIDKYVYSSYFFVNRTLLVHTITMSKLLLLKL